MFWISIAAIFSATALVQLGALAVTVQILKAILAIAVAVVLPLAHALVVSSHNDTGL